MSEFFSHREGVPKPRPLDHLSEGAWKGIVAAFNRALDRNLFAEDFPEQCPDRGVQYLSIAYSERLAENDIVASVGSKGDSYDNALVESFNGLYKWELIHQQGPWRGLDDVEFATMTYVDWFNHRRLHGEITNDATYTTPAEHERRFYRHTPAATVAVTQ